MPIWAAPRARPITYANTNELDAPGSVSLEFVGNEVMRTSWDGADGYRVTIHQKKGSGWKDTGFGYDLDKDATSINMALTVGGNTIEAGSLDCKSARGVHLYLHPYGSRLETDG